MDGSTGTNVTLDDTATANAINAVIAKIPIAYKEVLRAPLLELASRCAKWQGVSQSYQRLLTQKAAGTLPSQLASVKVPTFQITDLFKNSARSQPLVDAINVSYNTFRAAARDAAIALKKAEAEFLLGGLIAPVFGPVLRDLVDSQFQTLKRDFGYVENVEDNSVVRYTMSKLGDEYQLTKQSIELWAQ
jgi:hypothetical protein